MDFKALRKELHDAKMRINMAWDTYLELEICARLKTEPPRHTAGFLQHTLDQVCADMERAREFASK